MIGARAGAAPTAVVAGGALIAIGGTVAATRVPFERTPLVFATLLLVLMLLPVVVAVWTRRFCLFDPPWVVLFLLGMSFPVQAIYLVGVSDYGNHLLPDRDRWTTLINVALLLCLVALVAFFVGYGARRLAERTSRVIPVARDSVDRRRLHQAVAALSVVGVLGWFAFFQSVGGLGQFVASLSEHNAASAGRFYLIWLVHCFAIANLLWFTDRVTRQERRGRWLYLAHLAVAVVLLLTLGGRAQVLGLLEMLVIIRFFVVRDVKVRHVVAFVAVAIAFLAVYGTFRESTESQLTASQRLELSPESLREIRIAERERYSGLLEPRAVADQILQYDYAPLDMFVLLLDGVPERFPYQYGASLLDVAYRPLPGALIPNKPEPLNTQYNIELLEGDRGGKKASILGEGYVNAHVAGIVLLTFLLGVFARATVLYRRRYAAVPAAVLIYAILFRFVSSMTGGGFGEIAMFALLYLIPVFLAYLYATGPSALRERAVLPRRLGI